MNSRARAFNEVVEKKDKAGLPSKFYWHMVTVLINDSLEGSEYSVDGDTIMCKSERAAKSLADVLEMLGGESCIGKYTCIEYKADSVISEKANGWYVDLM